MKISVIMTSYNYADVISEAIKSVQAQTFSDWELIITDDCSTDNSSDVIRGFATADNRIKFFQNSENIGLKNSILKAIEATSGEWVAFLESDDFWEKDYLEKKVKIAEKYPDVGIIFNHVKLFGDDEKRIMLSGRVFEKIHKNLQKQNFPKNIFYNFISDNIILTFSCVMLKKSALNTEYFNSDVDRLLDWWLYIHLTRNTNAYYIPEKLTNWRFHKTSYTRKSSKKSDFFSNLNAYYDVLKHDYSGVVLYFILAKLFIQKFFVKSFRKIQNIPLLIDHKFQKFRRKF